MLQELHPDQLWVAAMPSRFMGIELGARMTVVRLSDGGLLLISPIDIAPLRRELNALGTVRFILAPNRFHYLCLAETATAYPAAKIYAAPGVTSKDVTIEGVLDDVPHHAWADVLEQTIFEGNSMAREAVFFHRASRTLILTDVCFNLQRVSSLRSRLGARVLGVLDRFGPSRTFRLATRDKAAARRSVERILQWDFERVVVAHGDIMESGGHAAFRRAFAWLLS